MNNTLYTCINKYNFNLSEMITGTELKISTSSPKIYHTLL